MKNFTATEKFIKNGVTIATAVALLQTSAIQAVFADESAAVGEVINSVEQGATGEYQVETSGYYLINLKGANGGKGQDVHIESDGGQYF